MTTITQNLFSVRETIEWLISALPKLTAVLSVNAVPPEDTSAGREFIQELLERNPDAFSSEIDVQYLMNFLPGRF